jgi:hypothetical protein
VKVREMKVLVVEVKVREMLAAAAKRPSSVALLLQG